ncbi:MAG TPA: HAMP domain-containing sensor histidine kinase [Cyclobacteriaceae bacterium]|nr:HAMP domain-containing sensor histidine kinase [Cyclobacteriaceae bacterium]
MKLLTRTVRNYFIYSALLVLLCTPLFYFTIEQLFARKMDEELIEHKDEFNKSLAHVKATDDLRLFNLMSKEFLLIPTNVSPIKDSLYSQTIYDSVESEMVPHRILRTGISVGSQHYELYIRESLVSNTELIGAIMGIQVVMLILLLIGSVLINRNLSKTIWNPFYHILELLKKYNIDQDPALNLPPSSTAEFRELSSVIIQLVEKNYKAYLNQKEFTENASHELQTPLAICRTKLELLAQTEELTEQQAELVESLLDATDRLTRLNKNLLLLSKIENRQFLESEQIDLKATIMKCLDAYADTIHKKSLAVKVDINVVAHAKGNPVLLEILINNLLSNAIRYSPDAGNIIIESTTDHITISNPGEAFEDPEKIFQRFHRESRSSTGSGLGLSIVKKICDVTGFRISYHYNSKTHHFKLLF